MDIITNIIAFLAFAVVVAGIVIGLVWALKGPRVRSTFHTAPAYRAKHVKGAHRA